MGTKIVNTNAHRASTPSTETRVVLSAGEVRELSGDALDAALAIPGVRAATKDDEKLWRESENYRATGGGQTVSAPSGKTSALTTEDVATLQNLVGTTKQGLIRDGVEVAAQPTLPATGGGELTPVADGKAALDRQFDPAAGDTDAELQQSGDPLDGFDEDGLRAYAEARTIELGNSTSRAGILKKIRAHEAKEREEAAQAAADGTPGGDGDTAQA